MKGTNINLNRLLMYAIKFIPLGSKKGPFEKEGEEGRQQHTSDIGKLLKRCKRFYLELAAWW